MIFMLLFSFLEPACTIIAQTIPIFRVLFIRIKRTTQKSKTSGVHMHPPTSYVELVPTKQESPRNPGWDGDGVSHRSRGESEHGVSDQRVSDPDRIHDVKV